MLMSIDDPQKFNEKAHSNGKDREKEIFVHVEKASPFPRRAVFLSDDRRIRKTAS